MKKAVLQKQVDEKRTEKRSEKKYEKSKATKKTAGSVDQNARKIDIRTLLIVSIDLFQNNLRLIRLGKTTFYYE